MSDVTPCLWFFHDDIEEAMHRYVEVFSRFGEAAVLDVSHYGDGAPLPAGSVLVMTVELDGQRVMGINGGPADFGHSPAFSLVVSCDGAEQVDHYWDSLLEGGEPSRCGWLVDRWGISWQVVPKQLGSWLSDPDPERAQRTMAAMLQMAKLDVAVLRAAYDGV
jgi:predicted 3-demethylubiquinone-9 3-methyltransferase (glyoxalase superfamily)